MELTDLADDAETKCCRGLSRGLLYLEKAVLPQASFIASKTQQSLGPLKTSDFIEASLMLCRMKRLKPIIILQKSEKITNIEICPLSDASHPNADETYGQTGAICALKIEDPTPSTSHPNL